MSNSAAPAVGIDIGKKELTVCRAGEGPANKWHVETVSLDDYAWSDHLLYLIPPGAIIAAEPTGYHYFLPIPRALELAQRPANIYYVNHLITASIRRVFLSRAKTDAIDARALALIAQRIAAGDPPRGVRKYNPTRAGDALALRLLMNEKRSATKTRSRTANQIDALAHGIWPSLAKHRETYITALAADAVTGEELAELAEKLRHADKRWMRQLARTVPEGLTVDPYTREFITQRAKAVKRIDDRIAHLDEQISAILARPEYAPTVQAWQTLPGVGPDLCAALLVATHCNPAEFTISQFKAAAGAAPHTGVSGGIDKTKLKRGAYAPARAMLHMSALTAVKSTDNPIGEYYARKRSLPAAKRKLAGILSGIARSVEQESADHDDE